MYYTGVDAVGLAAVDLGYRGVAIDRSGTRSAGGLTIMSDLRQVFALLV